MSESADNAAPTGVDDLLNSGETTPDKGADAPRLTETEKQSARVHRKELREQKRVERTQGERASAHAAWRRVRAGLTEIGHWLASGPVSLTLAVIILAVRIVAQAVGNDTMVWEVATGVGEPWWTIFSYVAWTSTWVHWFADTLLLLTAGIWLERRIHPVWFAVIGLGSAWLGSTIALGVAKLAGLWDQAWAEAISHQYISGITAFLVGVALATSVTLDALWRRRVVMVTLTILGASVLFSGSIDSVSSVVAALVGWAVGLILWGKSRDRRLVEGSRHEQRILVALLVASVTLGTLLALRSGEMVGALASLRGDYLTDVDPQQVAQVCGTDGLGRTCAELTYMLRSTGFAARWLTVAPLVIQLVLAWGLRGGRRAAFWGTIGVQGVTAALALGHLFLARSKVRGWEVVAPLLGFGDDGEVTAQFIVPIVVPLALMILVAATYPLFTVKAAPKTYPRFWAATGLTLLAGLIVSLIVGLIARHTFTPEASFWSLIGDYFIRLLPAPALYLVSPALQSDSVVVSRVIDWMALAPWITAAVALIPSFTKRALPNAISRARYKEIVEATNAGTMAWMSTWDGNNFWKSPNHEAAIAYRADGGVALTVTDPASLVEDREEVMREFCEYCLSVDLVPAFYSVHTDTVEITDSWGWPRLQVAEETILELPELAFTGKKFQDVRTAINRAKKEGVSGMWTEWSTCPADLKHQIESMSEQWASGKDLPEMGFTLGGVAELDDPGVLMLLAVDEGGKLHGATSWMPVYDQGDIIGYTLDFMRRREDGFKPVMEFMIAEAALWAKEENYEILSLSGAPLAKADAQSNEVEGSEEGSSSGALDFILELLGKTLEPVYGFRSLLRFKAKFRPTYDPVFLTIPDVSSLATVGLAIAHAYVPNMSARDMAHMVSAIRGK